MFPAFVLGNPLANTEDLQSRKQRLLSPATSIDAENDACSKPEETSSVDMEELIDTGRSAERASDDHTNGDEDSDHTSGGSSKSDDFTDPAQDPAIRKWHTRQQVLKHNRARRVGFEHERDQILMTAKRGRRNGLVAPLPGDPSGRKKLPICENCKGCRARKRCVECEQVLCDRCHARLHELAQRRHHRFEELQPQFYVGHELKQVVQEREANSLGHFIQSSREQVTLMNKMLLGDAITKNQHEITMPLNNSEDPEVDKFKRKKRIAREKEIMQMQISVPVASAKHAAREGEGEIFTNPAEIELANLYIVQKKFGRAKELLLQTQQLVQASLGVLHPTMLKISIGLAKVYQVCLDLFCWLTIAVSVHMSDSSGACSQETGHPDASVQTMRDSLALFESVLPPDHKDVLLGVSVLLTGLVRLLEALCTRFHAQLIPMTVADVARPNQDTQAKYDDAVHICCHWLEIRKLSLPPDHSSIREARLQIDEFVAKRESICISNEDQVCLEMNERNAERSEQQLRDNERCAGLCSLACTRNGQVNAHMYICL